MSTAALAGLPYGSAAYGTGWYDYGPATIIATPGQIVLPEGTSAQVSLRLNIRPPSSQTVEVSRFSGDADIAVSGPSQFIFTATNWDHPQTVMLTAAADADSVNGQAVIRAAGAEIAGTDITVTESDRTGPDDVDGDGRSNHDEYVAGTDWLDARSLLELMIAGQETHVLLSFEALATTPEYGGQTRHYRLETTPRLDGAVWEPVPGAEDIVTYGPVEFPVTTAEAKRFYRVRAWLTPPGPE